jgi:hypothetical protein
LCLLNLRDGASSKGTKGVSVKRRILEDATFGVLHKEDSGVLQKDEPQPDEKVEELPECNVDSKPVRGPALLQSPDLTLNPWKEDPKKLRWRIYVNFISE